VQAFINHKSNFFSLLVETLDKENISSSRIYNIVTQLVRFISLTIGHFQDKCLSLHKSQFWFSGYKCSLLCCNTVLPVGNCSLLPCHNHCEVCTSVVSIWQPHGQGASIYSTRTPSTEHSKVLEYAISCH
jgi:hypothetical protein